MRALLTETKHIAQKGFTLVELLIVVIILGILAAIVIPQFSSSTDDAKFSALDANLATMRSAIELYRQEHSAYPGATETAAAAGDEFTEATLIAQLTKFTDATGKISNTKTGAFVFGPYLKKLTLPENAVTGVATVAVLADAADGDLTGVVSTKLATDNTGGWLYDATLGKLVADRVDLDDR